MAEFFRIIRGAGHIIVLLWLIGTNLIPLYGVMKWGWQVSEIIFLYGAETMIIALFCVAKMMTARVPSPEDGYGFGSVLANVCAYLGIFAASGVGVVLLDGFFDIEKHLRAFEWQSGLGLAVTGLLVSYFSMFLFDYIFSGKFIRSQSGDAMLKPVGRVFFTAFFALIGGGLTTLFGQPIIALIILCLCKLLWDVCGYIYSNLNDAMPRIPHAKYSHD